MQMFPKPQGHAASRRHRQQEAHTYKELGPRYNTGLLAITTPNILLSKYVFHNTCPTVASMV